MPTLGIAQHCLLATATLVAAGIGAAPASADPLLECPNSFSTNDKPGCQLTSADPLHLRFENRSTGTTVQICVIAADAAPRRTLTEHIDGSAGSGVLMLRVWAAQQPQPGADGTREGVSAEEFAGGTYPGSDATGI